ncbi:hypothetical protein DLAC_06637 [Tieghemostelium lacteum]|uniref:EGF-like domain-containing protein n=1 Tax=Tieghemostelium lacteum TaxID=361077 RepID=A0A151ZF92_TIELA|nr:hypothetical protein DLAC_06637 [Tieghemostelium lacteum]|eukprot:KYQ92641.1 hypothetical protein DLAC_06637 [Tieghemostelium lacteum]
MGEKLKFYLFIFILFIYVTNSYTVTIIPSSPDNNKYADSNTGCQYSYYSVINLGNSPIDNAQFTIDAPNLVNEPNVTVISTNSSVYYVQFEYTVAIGGKGLASVVLTNTSESELLALYDCEMIGHPILNTNNNIMFYPKLKSSGWYYALVSLNITKLATFKQLKSTTIGYKCKTSLVSDTGNSAFTTYSNMIIYCKLGDILADMDMSKDVSYSLVDVHDRESKITIPTFITNSVSPIQYTLTTYPDPRNTTALTKRENYVYFSSNSPNLNDYYFLNGQTDHSQFYYKRVLGTDQNRVVLAFNYLTESISSVYSFQATAIQKYKILFKNVYGLPISQTNITEIESNMIFSYNELNYFGFSSKISSFNPRSYQYTIVVNQLRFYKTYTEYPYDITHFNGGLPIQNFQSVFYNYSGMVYFNQKLIKNFNSGSTIPSDTPPVIKSFDFVPLGGGRMIIRISVVSQYGVYKIQVNNHFELFNTDISSGTYFDGTLEKVVKYDKVLLSDTQAFISYDFPGNMNTQLFSQIQPSPQVYPKFPLNSDNNEYFYNITSIKFSFNNIDLSQVGAKLNMFISFKNMDRDFNVYMNLVSQFPDEESEWIAGKWNENTKQYSIEFTLQARRFTGQVNYQILYMGLLYTQETLAMTNLDYQLNVYSAYADEMPPLITNIVSSGNKLMYTPGDSIYWDMTITDQYNGLRDGLVMVFSNKDSKPYEIKIQPGPTIVNNVYRVSIPLNSCISNEVFTIQYIELTDNGNQKSIYDPSDISTPGRINPFLEILSKQFDQTLTLTTSCSSITNDTTPPFLEPPALNLYPAIDAGSPNRILKFNFVARDTDSLISSDHIPLCRIQAALFDDISVRAIPNSIPSSTRSYFCTFNLPFGYGGGITDKAYVSIFGVVDNYLNINYLTDLDFYTKLTFTTLTPVIDSVDEITSDGKLSIFGHNFGNSSDSSVSVGFNDIPKKVMEYHSNVLIVIDVSHVTESFLLTVIKNGEVSNQIYIYITPTTTPVLECPGTPPCGGPNNGICDPKGVCQCKDPWIGLNCLSQNIVTQPNINTTKPNIEYNHTLPDGENVTLKSLISVVALNELDVDGGLVQPHTFTNWLYSNTTSVNSTNMQEFTYLTNITNRGLVTSVKVKLQYFNNKDQVFFANEYLDMNPSSLKYLIELSPYNFTSQLNHLQLLISASIQSSAEDACSAQETLSNTDSDYVKLQVNSNSLYGRFIKRGIVDNRIRAISNSPVSIDSNIQTKNQQLQYIGINIPNYKSSVVIDPDFSLLVDSDTASDKENSVCQSKSTGLTRIQKIGIIVGCSVFGLIILIIGGFLLYKHNLTVKVNIQRAIKLKK